MSYNGWSNYATWRVNLEMVDGLDPLEFLGVGDEIDVYTLTNALREYCEEHIEETGAGLARDYALAFLSDVNWREIAEHLAEDDVC